MKKVVVLDPSVGSGNTGDLVIARAALPALEEAFSGCMITRLSMHQPLGRPGRAILRAADLVVFAGTNMLGPQLWLRRQFKAGFGPLFRARSRIVLYGVGKNTRGRAPDLLTRWIYRRLLSPDHVHSVRDGAAEAFLRAAGIANVQVTGCPTTSAVDAAARGRVVAQAAQLRAAGGGAAVVALTDYDADPRRDATFLRAVLAAGVRDLLFWPQGLGDIRHVERVAREAQLGPVRWLPPGLDGLEQACRRQEPTFFAGTRLHAAMFCLARGVPSVLLAIDNRVPDFAATFPLLHIPPGASTPLSMGAFASFYDEGWQRSANVGERCGAWLRETRRRLDEA